MSDGDDLIRNLRSSADAYFECYASTAAADEIEAAVSIIRALVAHGHQALNADVLDTAAQFLSRYTYEENCATTSLSVDSAPLSP